ncbi:MAG: energy transducer TonB [Bacteroidetes bacterium]|nr:energy transducer TonB [Bacteroidota bacterium]
MNAESISKSDYLDILFDNRNKAYGGYLLRKNYDARALKAFSVVACAILVLSVYAIFNPKEAAHLSDITHCPIIPVNPTIFNIDPPKPIPQPVAPAASKATTADAVLKITKDELVETPPPTNAEASTKDPGISNTDGTSGNANTTNESTASITSDAPPPTTSPIKWAEVMPEYIGDMNAYFEKTLQYPEMARDNGIEGTVYVQFVVNEDGSISNARVIKGIGGGCNEEALRVVNGMHNWKPGKNNDRFVKVYFTLPIKFVLQ